MTTDNYQDILNRARSEIPEPVDIPSGTWRLQAVSGKYTEDTVPTKNREAAKAEGMIVWKPIEPSSDVDEELFTAFAEDSLDGARIFDNFWLHDLTDIQTLNRKFDDMGMPSDLTIKDAIKQVKGYEVMAYVFQKADTTDADRFYTNVKQFASVEE